MPFFMPPPQMAMLTPQQQQALWQQQMQLYQFQQMQMFQFQQQQQVSGANGAQPSLPPQMMMMMPHPMMPFSTTGTPAMATTTPDSTPKKGAKKRSLADITDDKPEAADTEDFHDAVDVGIDTDESNKIGV
jgi:hypothetical protein